MCGNYGKKTPESSAQENSFEVRHKICYNETDDILWDFSQWNHIG